MKIFNKQQIKDELLKRAGQDLEAAKLAHQTTASFKGNPDFRQEGKYDTRSIEAGYLEQGQQKRILELQEEIALLEEIPTDKDGPSLEVELGSVVELELNSEKRFYYLSSTAGGTLLSFNQTPLLVVSVFSPIGQAVLSLSVGDEFEIGEGAKSKIYRVLQII